MSIKGRILDMGLIDWIGVVCVVGFVVLGIGESIDWLDRRSCRNSGGSVQVNDSHRNEWRCVGRQVAP